MKWTKEDVRKAFPYPIIPAYAAIVFTINDVIFKEFDRNDAVVLIGSIVGMLLIRFAMGRIAKSSLALMFMAVAFGNEAKAQSGTKYVMGFSVGNAQQPLGFYTHEGKPYPGQTGAPGYFHSSHEWIVNDLNGGKLVDGDHVTLLNKAANQYLMVQKQELKAFVSIPTPTSAKPHLCSLSAREM